MAPASSSFYPERDIFSTRMCSSRSTVPTALFCAQLLLSFLIMFSYARPLASEVPDTMTSERPAVEERRFQVTAQIITSSARAVYAHHSLKTRSPPTNDDLDVHCFPTSDYNLLPVNRGACAKTLNFMAHSGRSSHAQKWVRGRQINFHWPGEDCNVGFQAIPKPLRNEMWMSTLEIADVAQAIIQGCSDQNRYGKGGHMRFKQGEDEGKVVVMAPFHGFHAPRGFLGNSTDAAIT